MDDNEDFIEMINNNCVPFHLLHGYEKVQKPEKIQKISNFDIITSRQFLSHPSVQFSDHTGDLDGDLNGDHSDGCDYFINDSSDSFDSEDSNLSE